MARSHRQIAAVGVLLCWGIALGWLALRHVGQSDQSRLASQAALRISPTEAWFRIMAGGFQLGYGGITLDTLSQDKYRIREQTSYDLPTGESEQSRTIRTTEYTLGAALTLDSLTSQYARPGHRWALRASGDGDGWDVELQTGSPGKGRLVVVPLPRTPAAAPVPLRAVPLRLSLVGALAARDERNLPVVSGWPPAGWFTNVTPDGDSVAIFADSAETDPITGRWEPVAFDTIATFALVADAPESPVRLMVDQRGNAVSIEYLFGVRWEREDFDIARARLRERNDSTASLPILVWGTPGTGPVARSTRYQVTRRDGSPVNARLLEYLTGGRQIAGQGRIIVLGDTGRASNRLRVAADPLIQSGDTAIVALANRLRTRLDSGDLAAVVSEIRKIVSIDMVLSWPEDAASALREGRARPEGAARLLAAVLRHAGWEAGIAIGVEPAGDTLRTHAWVEASRRGMPAVRTIDPLTGLNMPSTWVRIAAAGSAAPEDLLPMVADVRFTISPRSTDEGEDQ